MQEQRPTPFTPSVPIDPRTIRSQAEFGAALTRLRDVSGLSIRRLAALTGVRPSTLGGYMSGRHLPAISFTQPLESVLAELGVTDPAELSLWMDSYRRVRHLPGPVGGRQREQMVGVERQLREAVSRQLAMESYAVARDNSPLAAHLAIAAHRIADTERSRSALLDRARAGLPGRLVSEDGPVQVFASADGRLLGGWSLNGRLRVWSADALVASELTPMLDTVVPSGQPLCATFGPGSGTVVVGCADSLVRTLRLDDPEAGWTDWAPGVVPLDVAFDAGGRHVWLRGRDRVLARFRTSAAATPLPDGRWTTEIDALCMVVNPVSGAVALGGWDALELRRADGELARPPEQQRGRSRDDVPVGIYALAASPDGAILAAATSDYRILLVDWSGDSGQELEETVSLWSAELPSGSLVQRLAFDPAGRSLAAGCSGRILRVYARTGDGGAAWSLVREEQHSGMVTSACFTARTGPVTGTSDGVIRVWPDDRVVMNPGRHEVFTVATAKGTGRVLAGVHSRHRAPALWLPAHDALLGTDEPGQWVHLPLEAGMPAPCGAVALADGGAVACFGTRRGEVLVYDLSGQPGPPRVMPGGSGVVENIAISEHWVVSGDRQGDVVLWSRAGAELREVYRASDMAGVADVAISPDERTLAVTGYGRGAWLWALGAPGTPPVSISDFVGTRSATAGIAYTPDSQTVLMGGVDGLLYRFDVSDPSAPELVGEPVRGGGDAIYSVAVGHESPLVVTGCGDGRIRCYDPSDLQEPVATIWGGGVTFSVALSADDAWLYAACYGSGVQRWPTEVEVAIDRIRAVAGDGPTQAEWDQHMPDQSCLR